MSCSTICVVIHAIATVHAITSWMCQFKKLGGIPEAIISAFSPSQIGKKGGLEKQYGCEQSVSSIKFQS